MSDMMDYYEELVAENDRLKVVLDIKDRELRASRKVVYNAYWHLAYEWQSHLFDVPNGMLASDDMSKKSPIIDMSIFAPEVYPMMARSDQLLYDALAAYKEAME